MLQMDFENPVTDLHEKSKAIGNSLWTFAMQWLPFYWVELAKSKGKSIVGTTHLTTFSISPDFCSIFETQDSLGDKLASSLRIVWVKTNLEQKSNENWVPCIADRWDWLRHNYKNFHNIDSLIHISSEFCHMWMNWRY